MLAEPTIPVWPRAEVAALCAGAATVVVVVMAVAAYEPAAGLGILAASIVLAIVVARPVRAAFLYLAATPLIAGLPRGGAIPQVRPSEALLALLLAGVGLRLLTEGLGGHRPQQLRDYRVTSLDRSILAMAVLGSFVPLLWRAARGYRPLVDDLLYATTLWKYLLVFVLFRLVIFDEQQVRTCVNIMLGAGIIVGAIAIAQAVNAPVVPGLLAALQDEPLQAVTNNRGSSTLGTSHGVADVMAFNLAFTLSFWWLRIGPRWLSASGACFFGLACLASGQFSAAVAVAVVTVTFGVLVGRPWRMLAAAVPASLVAGALLWPVLEARLNSTDASGVPESWAARRFNLTNYFWPELFRDGNWILGVRPAGRLPSFEPWREWVYIESGHTWLLWTGGVPLLLAFLWLSWGAARGTLALADRPRWAGPGRSSATTRFGSALGLATAPAFAVVFVLMLFDIHLTLRGPADALFPLLALLTVPALWPDHSTYRRALLGRPLVRKGWWS